MKILNFRRVTAPASARGFMTVARFNAEPMDGLVLYDFNLVLAPDGRYRVYSQKNRFGDETISFSPEFRSKTIENAILKLDDAANENSADRQTATSGKISQ